MCAHSNKEEPTITPEPEPEPPTTGGRGRASFDITYVEPGVVFLGRVGAYRRGLRSGIKIGLWVGIRIAKLQEWNYNRALDRAVTGVAVAWAIAGTCAAWVILLIFLLGDWGALTR